MCKPRHGVPGFEESENGSTETRQKLTTKDPKNTKQCHDMANLRLTLSCNEYDRTRFLVDGTIKAEGIDLDILALPSEERHRRFSRDLEFDVCELQMGVFLGWMDRGAPFTAIPVFPHRKFCHGNVLVYESSGIQTPEDFAGKIVGMRAHFNPVSLWMRGLFQDEYGVPARSLKLTERAENRRCFAARRNRWLHAAGNFTEALAYAWGAAALAEFS
jgi:hypothetical protein